MLFLIAVGLLLSFGSWEFGNLFGTNLSFKPALKIVWLDEYISPKLPLFWAPIAIIVDCSWNILEVILTSLQILFKPIKSNWNLLLILALEGSSI